MRGWVRAHGLPSPLPGRQATRATQFQVRALGAQLLRHRLCKELWGGVAPLTLGKGVE